MVRVCAVGVESATVDGVRINVGDNPVASATSPLLAMNWIEYVRCSPGQKVAALANNTAAGSLSVVELSD
jgi:hypothetical protein